MEKENVKGNARGDMEPLSNVTETRIQSMILTNSVPFFNHYFFVGSTIQVHFVINIHL